MVCMGEDVRLPKGMWGTKEGLGLLYGKKGGIEAEGWYISLRKLNAGVVARPPMAKLLGKRLSSSKDRLSNGKVRVMGASDALGATPVNSAAYRGVKLV